MRAQALVPALALLAAGCLAPSQAALESSAVPVDLLPALYEDLLFENDVVKAADGKLLDSWVFLPDAPEGTKFPVVVMASPYWKNLDKLEGPLRKSFFVDYFGPRGYAIVMHSIRGTGDSEGCFDFGGELEQQDLYDVVEHYGTVEWSNGNVALFGVSYVGTTPWEAAILRPPHLKTIVPVAGISDMYRYMYFEGTGYSLPGGAGGGPTFPTYYYPSVDWGVPVFGAGVPVVDELRHMKDSACQTAVQAIAKGYQTQVDGAHDAFWDERDYSSQVGEIDIPVFVVHGLQDWNVKPDNFEPMLTALQQRDVPTKAWLGQWEHNIPARNTFNKDWSRADWNATLQKWFDRWLYDVPNGVEADAAVEVQDALGAWRNETAWPPARAENVRLFPLPSGVLAGSVEGEGALRFTAMPMTRPVVDEPFPFSGQNLGDRVVFTTDPLASDLRLAGTPTVNLTVTRATAGDGHLVVALFDVEDSGTWQEIDRGFLNLRQWQSRDEAGAPPVGTPFTVTVRMYPQDLVLEAGHRLSLVVAGEHEEWILPAPTPQTYTLHVGEGTFLTIPVLPEADGGLATAPD